MASTIASRLGTRPVDGLSVRFVESEKRETDALLLSPWPESVFAYEPIWSRLADLAHLVAVDLPGFGHSQGLDSLMSPRPMGEFVAHLADTFGLDNPHLIGPDIGASAALFAAALHPKTFRSLVVGSGGTVFPLQLAGVLKEWVEATDLKPYRGVGRQIVAEAMTTLERYVPSDAAREDYLSSYEGDRFAESTRYAHAYATDLPLLRDLLPRIQTPVQIIAGKRDAVVPMANHEYLHQRLPRNKLDVIDASHWTWEDGNDEFAGLVTAFWRGGYVETASRTPEAPQ